MLMTAATRVLAYHNHQAHLPDVVGTLLYIVAVIATIVAFVGLLVSLVGGVAGPRTGWRGAPFITNWWYAAIVALIAWLLLAFL